VTSPTIIISASNKNRVDLEPFLTFGGNIYFDKGNYGHFIWYISQKSDILNILEYLKKNPLRSHKLNRSKMINLFYKLKELKAHKIDNNIFLYNQWKKLETRWKTWDLK
jgi:hypothetical protein